MKRSKHVWNYRVSLYLLWAGARLAYGDSAYAFRHYQRSTARLQKAAQTEQSKLQGESFLDPSIPLGYPPIARPEIGPDPIRYYTAKHARGECGTFWPLHLTALPQRRY
jgi:hypothetical protein